MNPPRVQAGSWTQNAVPLRALPAALETLIGVLERRLQRPDLAPSRRADLEALHQRLGSLRGGRADRPRFEAIVDVCYTFAHHRSESFLAFVYTVMYQPLTRFTVRLLRQRRLREDHEVLAVDLVGTLFAELAEAYMDSDDEGGSHQIPPVGRVVPWLFQAIRHDVMDHCKSGSNRLEQSIEPALDEGYEEALERLSFPLMPGSGEGGWNGIDAMERRDAFISAFEDATAELKPRHREVLKLRELENASVDAIAERLELTRQKVMDLLQYGREKRAQLMVGRLRSFPVLADLTSRPDEMTALLQRVRLWCLTLGLRPPGSSTLASPPQAELEAAWLPLDDPRRGRSR